jgi:1D-myo-inositol-tetrakisphosphate 5-kinase/inositol-polyphosphate multikinase
LVQLREIVPHYYGTEEIDGKTFIVLENLLTGYEHPNLLDCKIGKVTWTRDHNEAKLADQQRKAQLTTTGSLGFRITGLVAKTQMVLH